MKVELTPEEEKLYIDCLVVYGPEAQLEQYLEECAGAVLAVRKFLRAKKHGDIEQIKKRRVELIGEIVDTMNMSIQMKKIMVDDDVFDKEWDFKINRQIKRVADKQHT
jgi:hypothetical protein